MRVTAGVVAGLVFLGIVASCGGAGSPGPVQVAPGVTTAPATSAPSAGATSAPKQTQDTDYGY